MGSAGPQARERVTLLSFLKRAVVLLGLTTLVSLFGRWHWLPDLFSHFVAHYALLSALVAVGLLSFRRPRWALLATACSVVAAVKLLPYLPSATTPAAAGPTLSILQFNVGDSLETLDIFPDWIETRSDDFDVVVLFEVDTDWADATGRLSEHFTTSSQVLRNDPFGVAVFARAAGAQVQTVRIGSWRLPSVVLTIPSHDSAPQVTVVASHAPAPIGARSWSVRNEHLEALGDLAARASADGEVVLAADLNTTPWSTHYATLTRRTHLRDTAAGYGYHPTWSPRLLPAGLGLPIDHLLISDGLVVVDRNVLPRLSSDHRPIATIVASTQGTH